MISPVKVWRNQGVITKYLGRQGKIVSYTIIRVGPSGFETQIPYPVVVVRFDDGDKMTGQLVDWQEQDLRLGVRVQAIIRRVRESDPEGVIPYGIKFRTVR